MRIYNSNKDKTIDKIEIYLTQEEAEDFEMRISDLALHPKIDDDVIMNNEGNNHIVKTDKIIYIRLYPFINSQAVSDRAKKIVLEDK